MSTACCCSSGLHFSLLSSCVEWFCLFLYAEKIHVQRRISQSWSFILYKYTRVFRCEGQRIGQFNMGGKWHKADGGQSVWRRIWSICGNVCRSVETRLREMKQEKSLEQPVWERGFLWAECSFNDWPGGKYSPDLWSLVSLLQEEVMTTILMRYHLYLPLLCLWKYSKTQKEK